MKERDEGETGERPEREARDKWNDTEMCGRPRGRSSKMFSPHRSQVDRTRYHRRGGSANDQLTALCRANKERTQDQVGAYQMQERSHTSNSNSNEKIDIYINNNKGPSRASAVEQRVKMSTSTFGANPGIGHHFGEPPPPPPSPSASSFWSIVFSDYLLFFIFPVFLWWCLYFLTCTELNCAQKRRWYFGATKLNDVPS